ncbi:MAG TPA: Ig-like domain-containing protein, partial [Patescibacteria group bacterium]|nr:Ig-like domain-containing protein [Patescibacteria group bacterium]
TVLHVSFSEPVVGLDPDAWVLTDPGGQAVALTAELESDSTEVTLTPRAPRDLSSRYRLELRGGATDAAGNALLATSWELTTRLDEDPLTREVPIVLQPGEHRLVRFDDAWNVAEERLVGVTDERWVTAGRRARLPASDRWFELAGGGLAGWWVAESPTAHAPGAVDVASFEPDTTVELPEGIHRLYRWDSGAMRPDGEVSVRTSRTIEVDRRAVVDGVLFVRATGDAGAAHWLAIERASAPAEASAQRVLRDEEIGGEATLSLGLGTWSLFRFDERGAVSERRDAVGRRGADELVIRRILEVGEARFFVVSGGDLDGWAVREDDRHTVSTELETASAE